jgi:2-haloacid dehalogenase
MKNINAVVFDLYGTLFDVHSVAAACEDMFPGRGAEMSVLWRQKQLEYTWLRSLMGAYENFERVTEDALRHTCAALALEIDAPSHQLLSDAYLRISPYADTAAALARLRAAGLPLGIISNGSRRSIEQVVGNAGLSADFDELISVEEVRVFKPHTSVYELAERRMRHPREQVLFISSNAWDASAARRFGFPVCWINRQGKVFDELGVTPSHTVDSLMAMAEWLV